MKKIASKPGPLLADWPHGDVWCNGTSCISIMTYLVEGRNVYYRKKCLPKKMFNFFALGTIWKNAIESYEPKIYQEIF